MKKTKKIKIWKVLRNVIFSILALFVVWIVFSNVMTAYEQKKYQPIGELVEVDGKEMHIYIKGDGKETFVLLSGLGTAAPAMDFEPLINELAKNNKVVVVEPFGYGWSDITPKERTVENIVEEIRIALKKSDIKGPYILMPHSISGIYSMYFANTYREEVKGIIGIDSTLPQALDYFGEDAPKMPKYLSFLAPIGITRLALYITPDDFLPIADKGTYSEKNLKTTKALSTWKGYNKNVVAEANELKENIDKTVDMKFPSNVPTLFFTTKKEKVTEDRKNKMSFYKTQLTDKPGSKVVGLEGHHYLHWTSYKIMTAEINKFTNLFSGEQ